MKRDSEWRRAADHVKEVYEQRPEIDKAERASTPEWLSTRYYGTTKASAVLMVLSAIGVAVSNDGRWYFHLFVGLLVVMGLMTFVSVRMDGVARREEVARIRKHGLDVYDSLIERNVWVFAHDVPKWHVLAVAYKVAVGSALLLEA